MSIESWILIQVCENLEGRILKKLKMFNFVQERDACGEEEDFVEEAERERGRRGDRGGRRRAHGRKEKEEEKESQGK